MIQPPRDPIPNQLQTERSGETDSVETSPSDPEREADETLDIETSPRLTD